MLGDSLLIPVLALMQKAAETLTKLDLGYFCLLPHRMFSRVPQGASGKRPDKQQLSPTVQTCKLIFSFLFMPVVTNICFEA